jgi:hypothetical protein
MVKALELLIGEQFRALSVFTLANNITSIVNPAIARNCILHGTIFCGRHQNTYCTSAGNKISHCRVTRAIVKSTGYSVPLLNVFLPISIYVYFMASTNQNRAKKVRKV